MKIKFHDIHKRRNSPPQLTVNKKTVAALFFITLISLLPIIETGDYSASIFIFFFIIFALGGGSFIKYFLELSWKKIKHIPQYRLKKIGLQKNPALRQKYTKYLHDINIKESTNYFPTDALKDRFQRQIFWKSVSKALKGGFFGCFAILVFISLLEPNISVGQALGYTVFTGLIFFLVGMMEYLAFKRDKERVKFYSFSINPRFYLKLKDSTYIFK